MREMEEIGRGEKEKKMEGVVKGICCKVFERRKKEKEREEDELKELMK